jgi:hypothetical protein
MYFHFIVFGIKNNEYKLSDKLFGFKSKWILSGLNQPGLS